MKYQVGSLVNGKLILGPVKEIEPRRCPHFIMVGEHYRPDGTCKCNDKTDPHMAEWGYVWNDSTGQWESGEDEK